MSPIQYHYLSEVVKARDKILLKVKELINFIKSIIMKNFPTAVGKMSEKNF